VKSVLFPLDKIIYHLSIIQIAHLSKRFLFSPCQKQLPFSSIAYQKNLKEVFEPSARMNPFRKLGSMMENSTKESIYWNVVIKKNLSKEA
jgi:hypothetical protein